jgi:rubredoxin
MTHTDNPLVNFYRTPKFYITLPSQYRFYTDDQVEVNESGELPVFSMTAKDEMIMKNPDALLNGEAVAQVITSCVPAVKEPRELISNDVDALLVAIQGATYGDDIDIETDCPNCEAKVTGVASIQSALENMTYLNESYVFQTSSGLTVEVKPFSYQSTIQAGIANFRSTRSLQSIAEIDDEEQQMKLLSENYVEIARLNFDLIVDSVANVRGKMPDGEEFVVSDRAKIREFLENCENSVGRQIQDEIQNMNNVGIQKQVRLECDECGHQFDSEVGFDPVNFFTGSSS